MKKYTLLNMFMILGIMQMSDLFCMHKLLKLTQLTRVVKPANVDKLTKLNKSFKLLNLRSIHMCKFAKSKLATTRNFGKRFKDDLGVLAVLSPILGAYGYYMIYENLILDGKREGEVEAMCVNLKYVLKNEPNDVERARYIIDNQPKLIKYLNSKRHRRMVTNSPLDYGFSIMRYESPEKNIWQVSSVISQAVKANNQPMVKLFREYFPMTCLVLNKFLVAKDHEDPEGMANLLAYGWSNSEKVMGLKYQCWSRVKPGLRLSRPCYYNKKGCAIFEKIADELIHDYHNEYVKSLKNSSKN